MKSLLKRIEELMVAITFAEVGELDTARRVLHETSKTDSEVLHIRKHFGARKVRIQPNAV
jgi:hypothetical protein